MRAVVTLEMDAEDFTTEEVRQALLARLEEFYPRGDFLAPTRTTVYVLSKEHSHGPPAALPGGAPRMV